MDVVVSNTVVFPTGAIAAALARRRHAWIIHEPVAGWHYDVPPFARWLLRHRGHTLATVSDFNRRAWCDWLGPVRIEVIDQWVELPDDGPLPPPIDDARPRILVVGATPRKRADEVLDAVGRLALLGTEVRLDVMGDGPVSYGDQLRTQAQRLGVAHFVRLLGPIDVSRRLLLQYAAVVVACRDETFGRAAVEALLAGVPVVAARAGATPAVLHGVPGGALYEPGDEASLAARVLHVLTSRQQPGSSASAAALHIAPWSDEMRFAAALQRLLNIDSEASR